GAHPRHSAARRSAIARRGDLGGRYRARWRKPHGVARGKGGGSDHRRIRPARRVDARRGQDGQPRGSGARCSGARLLAIRSQHRHPCLQSAAQARTARGWRRAHQGRARSRLPLCVPGQTGGAVRRFFVTIFLWFLLTLCGVTLILFSVVAHHGYGYRVLVRMTIHDLSIFLIAGGIFCYFISSYLTKPVYRLSIAAAKIAEGRLDTRVDPKLRKRRDEIAELARNFDHMAERIEALVTGQRRLLGDVSHELRSPLARLMVALTLVKQGPAQETAES